MLNPSQFYDYQKKAILHQLYNPDSMLWLGCGLGKTIVTLTTIEHRIRSGQVQKVLVFGPLRVICSVWEREARKWEHTKHLRFSILHGNEKKRTRQLFASADIYLCNYENMNWLTGILEHYYTSQDKPLPFQMVVYDEITRVKNSTSMRIKGGNRVVDKGKPSEHSVKVPGWRKMIDQFQYRTGLTGTPGANGYLDLFGQYLVIDGGQRIGKYITHYKEAYFTKGYDGWSHEITDIGKQVIEDKISDITIRMDEKDYLELPPLKINDIVVRLPDKIMKRYREIERDMFTQLDDGTEFELFNRISVSNKCLQFANGSPYLEPENPEYVNIHDEKLQVLDSILEEAQGKTVLLGYIFKSDADRIMKRYKKLNPVNLTTTPPKQLNKVIDSGNKGRIKLMIGHPASLGHGVDGLNDFCNILVWFGLPWSLELYEQMIGRIASGQRFRKPVTMHRILCENTIDFAVSDALRDKNTTQDGLKKAIQNYRKRETKPVLNFM